MQVKRWVRWLPKYGNAPEEYEDAYSCPTNYRKNVLRFAIADGATEASFSREWAQILVHAFRCGQFEETRISESLLELSHEWLSKIKRTPLPWYAEEKLRFGTYSSLLGIKLYQNHLEPSGKWEALGIGDSCLFQIHDHELITKWPVDNYQKFSYHPTLISTNLENNKIQDENKISGYWNKGDLFYLMTDAIAQYFLKSMEEGCSPESIIPNITQNQFIEWIQDLRKSKLMKNDDVTVVFIKMK